MVGKGHDLCPLGFGQVNGLVPEAAVPERTNAFTKQYVEACKQVAADLDIPVLDLWTKMQEAPNWDTAYLSDGLHLTPEGNKFLFDNLQELINTHLPHLR